MINRDCKMTEKNLNFYIKCRLRVNKYNNNILE